MRAARAYRLTTSRWKTQEFGDSTCKGGAIVDVAVNGCRLELWGIEETTGRCTVEVNLLQHDGWSMYAKAGGLGHSSALPEE